MTQKSVLRVAQSRIEKLKMKMYKLVLYPRSSEIASLDLSVKKI